MHSSRNSHSADEPLGIEHVVVVAARHDQPDDQSRLLVRLEQGEVLGRPHLHGNSAERINDGRSKRHEWQRRWNVSLQNVVFTLGGGHATPLIRAMLQLFQKLTAPKFKGYVRRPERKARSHVRPPAWPWCSVRSRHQGGAA